jgi:hypothetical protein
MSKSKMVTKKFSSFFKRFGKSKKRRTMRKKNRARHTRKTRNGMKGG